MRWIVLMTAGLGIAGFAGAQEEAEEYDPGRDIVSETPEASEAYDPGRDIVTDESRKPSMSMGEGKRDSPLNTEYGPEDSPASNGDAGLAKNQGLSKAKAEDLEGRTVVTLTGDEVGEIRGVGKSPSHEERVATIDAGGFLGVGEKTVAVPLSELHRTPSDGEAVRIGMLRTSIESLPAFDESELEPDDEPEE
jgi:hypothetical protein